MKITKSQKEAVISLLKEKFDEKEKEAFNAFKAKNGSKIQKEFADLIELRDKIAVIGKQYGDLRDAYDNTLAELGKKNEGLRSYAYGSGYCAIGNYADRDQYINALIKSKFNKLPRPDFSKVERQLELDSLSKDFDLNAFIEKYLGE